MPNGPTRLTQSNPKGLRSPEVDTRQGFDSGFPPRGIFHRFTANDRGIIGNDVSSFPTTGSAIPIPNRAIVKPAGKAHGSGIPTIDDAAFIPAFSVGDPW